MSLYTTSAGPKEMGSWGLVKHKYVKICDESDFMLFNLPLENYVYCMCCTFSLLSSDARRTILCFYLAISDCQIVCHFKTYVLGCTK